MVTDKHVLINFLGGATQATLTIIVGHPFDLVKTRLQTGDYKNSFDCLKYSIRKDGILGLYRGCSMPWLSYLVKRPIQYPISEYMKENKIANNYIIGAVAGSFGPVFGTPLEVVKVVVQTSAGTENRNSMSYIKENYKRNGLKGFYRGFLATVLKDSLHGMSFVGNYYTFRDYLGTDKWYKNFLSGAVANCITWYTFMPIDYVKTRIQKSESKLTVSEVIKSTLQEKGVKTFWKGVVPACARTIPVSGVGMVGYEWVRVFLTNNIRS